MRPVWLLIFALLAAVGFWWVKNAPPTAIKIGEPLTLEATPSSILSVRTDGDYIARSVSRTALALPPYDEVVLSEDQARAYVSAVDGWLWQVDLTSGAASRFVDTPLMPAGAHLAPDNDRVVYFCASRFYWLDAAPSERVGLYRLDLETKDIKPLVLNVPLAQPPGGEPVVYSHANAPRLQRQAMTGENSRKLAFCNDLDVSADGRRIYFTEPFSYGTPSMGGGGTYREAISLGRNGFLWRYDFDTDEISLVAQNFTFLDGVLVEDDAAGMEESILVTETVKFTILRLRIGGAKAGTYETVWQSLPGMPDGMDRDSAGRVWIGLVKQRSSTIDWIHKNPWIKPLLLRAPYKMMPVSRATGILALSPDASQALFYAEHDGSVLTEISVVVPGRSGLYLATIGHQSKGLYQIPYPEGLAPRDFVGAEAGAASPRAD